MSVTAILGSGFGLYGYLPAAIEAGAQKVLLPERYQDTFSARAELAEYRGHVTWVANERAALEGAETAVLALRPDMQVTWASACLALPHIKHMLLEKPLVSTPGEALLLFEKLVGSGKNFRIGYIFRFSSWAQKLLQNPGDISHIEWTFLAHHFRHPSATWKQQPALGGGALRFYGIQLIALLAELGYREVIASDLSADAARWTATFGGKGLADCSILLDSKSPANVFRIAGAKGVSIDQDDPFDDAGNIAVDRQDRRVCSLTRLCHSLWEGQADMYAWYREALNLWNQAESHKAHHGA